MLGMVLAHWTTRLLDASRHRWFGSEATARRLAAFNRWFPVLALAVAFCALQDSATGWFYPYRAIAIGLAFARPTYLTIIKLVRRPLRSATLALHLRVPHWMVAGWPYLAALASAACLVVIFGTADKDHIAELPISSVAIAQFLGPLNLLLLFFAIFVSITSVLILTGRFLHLPLTALVIFCAIVFSWFDLNDNHAIRIAEETANDKPADVQAAFDRWMSQRPDRNRFGGDYPVVLVSAEGGGIRAAFFTAVTLARIIDRCPPLAHRDKRRFGRRSRGGCLSLPPWKPYRRVVRIENATSPRRPDRFTRTPSLRSSKTTISPLFWQECCSPMHSSRSCPSPFTNSTVSSAELGAESHRDALAVS
jgi:hypothetical protein